MSSDFLDSLQELLAKDSNMNEKAGKREADAQFAKIQRANDAKSAKADYETAAAAIRAKTERLKALRLARDAAAPPEPAAPKRKGKKSSSGSLADYLDTAVKDGRNG